MNRYKNNIVVLIGKLDHFMHPSLIIAHSDKSPEYSHSIIYMHYIVAYGKGSQVIYRKLLALLDRTSYAYTVKTVKYLMVAVTAYLVVMVDESVMYILSRNEFRKNVAAAQKNRLQSVKL